ncbi:unnamed protein product [Symbiodinium sp. CCMP2592]|nr:unnamed protein product [Symbiodinium sp. CCMP2592]
MFLYSLSGRFDTAAQHILKLIADDAGTLQEQGKEQSRSSSQWIGKCKGNSNQLGSESSCASALPEPERVSLRCFAEGCPSADQVAEEVLGWQRLQISLPGWYAACYCQVANATAGCEDGSWQLLGWQLAAGVATLTAGSSGASPVVYRGGHFLLSLRGNAQLIPEYLS